MRFLPAAAVLLCTALGSAQMDYVCVLSGDQQVPRTPSAARGTGHFAIDTDAHRVFYNLGFSGLSSAEVQAGIYGPAEPGQVGRRVFLLPAGERKNGCWNYPEEMEQPLLAGKLYVGVSTVEFPDGEVRGQLVTHFARLSGQAMTPPTDSTATGYALLVLDGNRNKAQYYISVSQLQGPETGAHIHGYDLPGEVSGVVCGLPGGNPKQGWWTFTEEEEPLIRAGLSYVQVHSRPRYPSGEVRGQLIGAVYRKFDFSLYEYMPDYSVSAQLHPDKICGFRPDLVVEQQSPK